jgi:2-oxoglutarate ferredoxin oxidoreductase subunit beta
LTFGSRGTFFARALDVDLKTSVEVMVAAARHKGASVVEMLVNCVIFNDGAHRWLSDKEMREERTIMLRHGEKMIFGKNRAKGLVLDGFNLKAVTIGENGVTEADILTHDATSEDYTLHLKLSLMQGPDLPVAMGVIRAVEQETYDAAVHQQIVQVQASTSVKTFDDLVETFELWER